MGKKSAAKPVVQLAAGKPSALLDTRVVYCGDNLEQLAKLPDQCVDLIYIDYMRPRCVDLPSAGPRVLKKTGSFYYRCDWHASHYVNQRMKSLTLCRA